MTLGDLVEARRLTTSGRTAAVVAILTAGVAGSEATAFYGEHQYTVPAYLLFLVALSLAPLVIEGETHLFQAFALVTVFRLVNLTMPSFFDLTLLWLPLVYAPLAPVFVYIGREALRERRRSAEPSNPPGTGADRAPIPGDVSSMGTTPAVTPATGNPDASFTDTGESATRHRVEAGAGLPLWLGGEAGGKLRWLFRSAWHVIPERDHRSLPGRLWDTLARVGLVSLSALWVAVMVLALFLVSVRLAEIEFGIVGPSPLIPSLDPYQVGVLAVVMIGVVGLVEELLFRGVLQQVLERRLGALPGLLVASAVFGVTHSAYGLPAELAFAGAVGLLFGIVYDLTDSLLLVAGMHGTINVFLFGVIPLDGGSSLDLVRMLLFDWLRVGTGTGLTPGTVVELVVSLG